MVTGALIDVARDPCQCYRPEVGRRGPHTRVVGRRSGRRELLPRGDRSNGIFTSGPATAQAGPELVLVRSGSRLAQLIGGADTPLPPTTGAILIAAPAHPPARAALMIARESDAPSGLVRVHAPRPQVGVAAGRHADGPPGPIDQRFAPVRPSPHTREEQCAEIP